MKWILLILAIISCFWGDPALGESIIVRGESRRLGTKEDINSRVRFEMIYSNAVYTLTIGLDSTNGAFSQIHFDGIYGYNYSRSGFSAPDEEAMEGASEHGLTHRGLFPLGSGHAQDIWFALCHDYYQTNSQGDYPDLVMAQRLQEGAYSKPVYSGTFPEAGSEAGLYQKSGWRAREILHIDRSTNVAGKIIPMELTRTVYVPEKLLRPVMDRYAIVISEAFVTNAMPEKPVILGAAKMLDARMTTLSNALQYDARRWPPVAEKMGEALMRREFAGPPAAGVEVGGRQPYHRFVPPVWAMLALGVTSLAVIRMVWRRTRPLSRGLRP